MSERTSKSEQSGQRCLIRAAAVAVAAIAVVSVGRMESGSDAPAKPAPAATAPAAPPENSAERHINAQEASRQDAVATLHAIGSLLRQEQAGGRPSYLGPTTGSNAGYDNLNDNDQPQPGRPALSILRNQTTNQITVTATTADGQHGLQLDAMVYDGPLAHGPINPAAAIQGPASSTGIDVLALKITDGGTTTIPYGDNGRGHLYEGADEKQAELTKPDVVAAGRMELGVLRSVADELRTALPPQDVDILQG